MVAHKGASTSDKMVRNFSASVTSGRSQFDNGELVTLNARAQDLVRNYGFAAGAIYKILDSVIGQGLLLSAKPDTRLIGWSKSKEDLFAERAEAIFSVHARSKDVDANRMLNFNELCRLVFRTILVSGESLSLLAYKGHGRLFNTCVRLLEVERFNEKKTLPNNRLVQGVERDASGEPVAYHLYKKHPGDVSFVEHMQDTIVVRSRDKEGRQKVMHIFTPERVGQVRGKSMLAPVIAQFNVLRNYSDSELIAAAEDAKTLDISEPGIDTETFIEAVYEDLEGPERVAAYIDDLSQVRKSRSNETQGNEMKLLTPGEKLTRHSPNRPNTAFKAFVETILNDISAGFGIPPEVLINSFKDSNYSSARAAIGEAWRRFLVLRSHFATNFCDVIYERVIEEAVMKGYFSDIISIEEFNQYKRFLCRAEWIGPGKGFLDPLKEAKASAERLKTTSSLDEECKEQGKDVEDVLNARSRVYQKAKAMSEEQGTPIEYLLGTQPTEMERDINEAPVD